MSLQKKNKSRILQRDQEELQSSISTTPQNGGSNLMLQHDYSIEDLNYTGNNTTELPADFVEPISNTTLDLLSDNSVRHPTILENYLNNSKENNEIKISKTGNDAENPKVIIELVDHTLCDNILFNYLPIAKEITSLKFASSSFNKAVTLKPGGGIIGVNENKELLLYKGESFTKDRRQQSREANFELTGNQAMVTDNSKSNEIIGREDNKKNDQRGVFTKLRCRQSAKPTNVNNHIQFTHLRRHKSTLNSASGESISHEVVSKFQSGKMNKSNLAADRIVPECCEFEAPSREIVKHVNNADMFSVVPQKSKELLSSKIKQHTTKSCRQPSRLPKYRPAAKRVAIKYFPRRKRTKSKYRKAAINSGYSSVNGVQSKPQSVKHFSSNLNDDCVVPLSFVTEASSQENQSRKIIKCVDNDSVFSGVKKRDREQMPKSSTTKGSQQIQAPSYELTTSQVMLEQEPAKNVNTVRAPLREGQEIGGRTLFSSVFANYEVTMGNAHMQEVPGISSQPILSQSNESSDSSDFSDDDSIHVEERYDRQFAKRLMNILNQDCVVPFSVRLNERKMQQKVSMLEMINSPLRGSMDNVNEENLNSAENQATLTCNLDNTRDGIVVNISLEEQNQTVPALNEPYLTYQSNNKLPFDSPKVDKRYILPMTPTVSEEIDDWEESPNPFNNGERLFTIFPPCTPSLSGKQFELDMSSAWRIVVTCMNEYCELKP